MSEAQGQISTVYGPVQSWRFGRSLGIDPIRDISTCSFNCIYCQLGEIQDVTARRREFVSLATLEADLKTVDWSGVDVVTFSGSGEPTLATNLGEMVRHVKSHYGRPVHLLTNATLFHLPEVREAVAEMDVIACKLDAATDAMLQKINRPAPGITVDSIVEGILQLKAGYAGRLELQIMFMPINKAEAAALTTLIRRIGPAEIQLNTPKRSYPTEWHVETRGAHNVAEVQWPTRRLATVSPEDAREIEDVIHRETGVPVVSVYRN